MDKRTRIAVMLIALILGGNLAYTAYYQKQKIRNQPRTAARPTAPNAAAPGAPGAGPTAGATSTPELVPSPATAEPQTGPGPFVAATGGEGDLVIETPLQRLRIARRGGVVRGLELLRFDVSSAKRPVDLVPTTYADPEHNGLGLMLRGGGNEWNLDAARFDPSPGDFDADGKLRLETGGGARTIVLRCPAQGGGALLKRFTVDPDRYDFGFDLQLEPGPGLPRIEGYTLGWTTGMPVTEGNPKEDENRFKVVASVDQQVVRKRSIDFKRETQASTAGTVHWAAMQSKYFLVGVIPSAPQSGTVELQGQPKTHWMGMRIAQPTPWRTGADSYRIYAGPIDYDHIRALGVGLDAAIELGWRWIRPISQLLLHFMQFLNKFIPNYGVVIIVVSLLAKLVFWPLTERSMRSMRRMAELQPRMEEIRRRYKDDPKAMNEQVMLMYREQKVNPVGGCMPILIQTPMFFALFSVLQSNIELRNAPFFAWIDNLAGPDVLYQLPMSLPVIGNHISLLPLLMGGSMLWQSAIGSTMGAPASGPMAQQQFMMKWLMPIMMTFFFYKMPSGLVLYWTVNTLMGIAQQIHINRKYPVQPVVVVAPKTEGRTNHARSDRDDGSERGSGAAERPGRARGQAR
jgi:YidC/Oxa1 family membrane protein insertase